MFPDDDDESQRTNTEISLVPRQKTVKFVEQNPDEDEIAIVRGSDVT